MLTSWRKYILAGMICLVAPAVTRTEIAEADSQVSVLIVSDAQNLSEINMFTEAKSLRTVLIRPD